MGTGWMSHCHCNHGPHEVSYVPLLFLAGTGAIILLASLVLSWWARRNREGK
jgi:hypothetical protein